MMCSDGYPAGTVTRIVDIKITSKHSVGWIFKKYVVCGAIIIDGVETCNMIEWKASKQEFKSLDVGDRIHVPSRWCGKFYTFSDFDLPDHRIIH